MVMNGRPKVYLYITYMGKLYVLNLINHAFLLSSSQITFVYTLFYF